jgi:hypothetical protein
METSFRQFLLYDFNGGCKIDRRLHLEYAPRTYNTVQEICRKNKMACVRGFGWGVELSVCLAHYNTVLHSVI